LALNALYFGVAVLAAGYAFLNPAVQVELTRAAVDAFSPSGGLGTLVSQRRAAGNRGNLRGD